MQTYGGWDNDGVYLLQKILTRLIRRKKISKKGRTKIKEKGKYKVTVCDRRANFEQKRKAPAE